MCGNGQSRIAQQWAVQTRPPGTLDGVREVYACDLTCSTAAAQIFLEDERLH